jgi:guanine deaminase
MSGGFASSILTEVRHASFAAKARTMFSPALTPEDSTGFASKPLTIAACLHLATLGGAHVCGLGKRIGQLMPGRAFDALLVSVRSDVGNLGLWGVDEDTSLGITRKQELLDSMLERFLFTGDDRNIKRVYVQGKWIGGAEKQ